MRRFSTNREYTAFYLQSVLSTHRDHPQFDLYVESELGAQERTRAFMRSLCTVFRNGSLFNGKRCIDIGCASGGSLIAFVDAGASVATGIEVSEARFTTAKVNIGGCPSNVQKKINLIKADIGARDIVNGLGTFDIIFCMDVLEHVDDLKLTVENICALMEADSNAFAFLSLRNSRHPPNVLHEPHYDIPGLTLLDYETARSYFAACNPGVNLDYEVRHWKSFWNYRDLFQSFGKQCIFYGAAADSGNLDAIHKEALGLMSALDSFLPKTSANRELRDKIYHEARLYLTEMETLIDSCRTIATPALIEQFHYTYAVPNIAMLVTSAGAVVQ